MWPWSSKLEKYENMSFDNYICYYIINHDDQEYFLGLQQSTVDSLEIIQYDISDKHNTIAICIILNLAICNIITSNKTNTLSQGRFILYVHNHLQIHILL